MPTLTVNGSARYHEVRVDLAMCDKWRSVELGANQRAARTRVNWRGGAHSAPMVSGGPDGQRRTRRKEPVGDRRAWHDVGIETGEV